MRRVTPGGGTPGGTFPMQIRALAVPTLASGKCALQAPVPGGLSPSIAQPAYQPSAALLSRQQQASARRVHQQAARACFCRQCCAARTSPIPALELAATGRLPRSSRHFSKIDARSSVLAFSTRAEASRASSCSTLLVSSVNLVFWRSRKRFCACPRRRTQEVKQTRCAALAGVQGTT